MSPDPFAVLGIAPTADLAAIKRAYFALLPRHPPHRDPDGFKRLRAAYEELLAPERRALRAVAGGFNAKAAWEALQARYGAAIEAARAAPPGDAGPDDAARVRAFVEGFSRLPLREAVARAGGRGASTPG